MNSSLRDLVEGGTALSAPETTASKRLRAAARRRGPRVVPGLDAEALRRRYAGDPRNTTQVTAGDFRLRLREEWESKESYLAWAEGYVGRRVAAYCDHLDRAGWAVDRVDVRPGVYPYRDHATGLDDPTARQMIVWVTGGLRRAPEPALVQLDPEDLEPTVIKET